MTFHWNPFLEFESGNHSETIEEIELYRDARLNPKPVSEQKNAATIFLGVGPWFAGKNDVEKFPGAFANLTERLPHNDIPDLQDLPITDDDGLGPQLFFAPPVPPNWKDGNPRKANPASHNIVDRVRVLTDHLEENAEKNNILLLRAIPELFRDNFAVTVDPEATGFHVIDSVAMVKANLYLNARCNAKLDRLHGYPYDRTCCTDYGTLPFPQLLLVMFGVTYLCLCILNEFFTLRSPAAAKSTILSMDIGIFVTALLGCYWADRTQAFPKGSKQFVTWDFLFLIVPVIILALTTLYKSAPRLRPGETEPLAAPTDAKPLSREQTDEWKGWMQAVILIYHWTGASRILGIYIFVRLLVAAYLFQSGFGHAVYFMTKKDFSFKRVASVLLRLNLLSCALPYVMNTDYMFYYFAPLVSFWFLIIYAVFAIAPQYNDSPALYAKFAIAVIICPGLMIWTPLTSWMFTIMAAVFQIHWDLHEWEFRLGLDGFIVYIGMLAGIASVQNKLYNIVLTQMKGLAGYVGFAAISFYYAMALVFIPPEKQSYNAFHPFLSFVPILGFIALRNISPSSRLWYSRSMAWLGRCSLETFTLQFHIFLAADTKGVLLLDIFSGGDGSFFDRVRDLIVIVPVFLWVSASVAEATNGLVKVITTSGEPQNTVEEIDLDLESNDDMALLGKEGGGKSWLRSLSPSSFARGLTSDLRLRIGGMLILMWLMNLVST